MPIIFSLTHTPETIWAIGPEGLFRYHGDELLSEPQPDAQPICCAAVGSSLLVGGAGHGVAYTLRDGSWQAAWMDGVAAPIVTLAADPAQMDTGIVLAGAAGDGLLRSTNRGSSWTVCNFGLQEYDVLCLAWAPLQPAGEWPPRQVVFLGTGGAVYRSPNGGRGWKRCAGPDAPVQALAVAPDFHQGGAVLAGTEETGLWISRDGGYSFAPVTGAPATVNALYALPDGWLLSDPAGIWHSPDGAQWRQLAGLAPALTFLPTPAGVLAGGANGIAVLPLAG